MTVPPVGRADAACGRPCASFERGIGLVGSEPATTRHPEGAVRATVRASERLIQPDPNGLQRTKIPVDTADPP